MRAISKPDRQPAFFKDWKIKFRRSRGRSAKYSDLHGCKEYGIKLTKTRYTMNSSSTPNQARKANCRHFAMQ